MNKFKILFLALFSILLLTACEEATVTTFNGNEVVLVETGVYDYFVELETQEQQEAVLKALSELETSEPDYPTGASNNYGLKLTYSTGDGCVIYLNYVNNSFTAIPFDTEGNMLHEQSQTFVVSEEQMDEFKVLFGLTEDSNVASVETGVYDNYVELETQNEQDEVVGMLSTLVYSEAPAEAMVTNNYSIKLTYENGEGRTYYFNFEENLVSIEPFNASGETMHEAGGVYSVPEEQLSEFKVLFGIE